MGGPEPQVFGHIARPAGEAGALRHIGGQVLGLGGVVGANAAGILNTVEVPTFIALLELRSVQMLVLRFACQTIRERMSTTGIPILKPIP